MIRHSDRWALTNLSRERGSSEIRGKFAQATYIYVYGHGLLTCRLILGASICMYVLHKALFLLV